MAFYATNLVFATNSNQVYTLLHFKLPNFPNPTNSLSQLTTFSTLQINQQMVSIESSHNKFKTQHISCLYNIRFTFMQVHGFTHNTVFSEKRSYIYLIISCQMIKNEKKTNSSTLPYLYSFILSFSSHVSCIIQFLILSNYLHFFMEGHFEAYSFKFEACFYFIFPCCIPLQTRKGSYHMDIKIYILGRHEEICIKILFFFPCQISKIKQVKTQGHNYTKKCEHGS